MLAAALIVFRESLEAALLIGIMAAATHTLPQRNRWLAIGMTLGLLGAVIIAILTEQIANLADGIGQELFNAAVLGLAVAMIGWHHIWMANHGAELARQARALGQAIQHGQRALSAIAVVVGLAVLREGAETVLFLQGVVSSGQNSSWQMLTGGMLGLFAGVLTGITLYLGLLRIPVRWLFTATGALLMVLAAGMASQMARLLVQADLLPSLASPLWDSTWLLSSNSALGTTLHVLIGYDARPMGMQVIFYLTTLLLLGLASQWVKRDNKKAVNLKFAS